VNNIIIIFRNKNHTKVNKLIKSLKEHYNISGDNPAQWFLGMEILRDLPSEHIWLDQKAYIEKIANLANHRRIYSTPMSSNELLPNQKHALPAKIQNYQRKIGSLLFATISTRPNIAFAISRLAKFLNNSSSAHYKAADRALMYLYNTRQLFLHFGGQDNLVVASDASFADNSTDRKSSQAFAMKLFSGLIGWRANKQDTITTLTTEVELLALAQAAKESMYVSKLLQKLTINLNDQIIQIEYKNTQTINLITKEIALLKTKLRHINIHNYWLYQKVQNKTISVNYTPSAQIMADGLIKALSSTKWQIFLN
jgi:hypothetical protein